MNENARQAFLKNCDENKGRGDVCSLRLLKHSLTDVLDVLWAVVRRPIKGGTTGLENVLIGFPELVESEPVTYSGPASRC